MRERLEVALHPESRGSGASGPEGSQGLEGVRQKLPLML